MRPLMESLGTSEDAVTGQAMVAEKLLDRVMPTWRNKRPASPRHAVGNIEKRLSVRLISLSYRGSCE